MVSPGTYTARVYFADKVANKATTYPVSGQFTVGGVTSIAVTSPTAGSTYAPGAALPVPWTPDFAASSGQFSIWVVSSQSEFYGGDIVAADGSASYTRNPTLTAPVGTGYAVRVYYRSTPAASWTIYGQSAGTFTISAGFTAITVTAPTGTQQPSPGRQPARHLDARLRGRQRPVQHLGGQPGNGWYGGKIVAADGTASYTDSVDLNVPVDTGYRVYVYYRATSGDPWSIYGYVAGDRQRDRRLQRHHRHRPHGHAPAAKPRAAPCRSPGRPTRRSQRPVQHLGGQPRPTAGTAARSSPPTAPPATRQRRPQRAGRHRLPRLRLLPRHAAATPGASTG